jgi:uridylate kinase
MKSTFVLSVGGSLLVTKDGINVQFLEHFRDFIREQIKQDRHFYLVVGGGYTARVYIQAALKTGLIKNLERDLVGIRATRLNAELLKVVLGSLAYPEIINDPTQACRAKQPVVIAGGYKPGWSTDYVAVLLAKHNNISTVINLSNIDYAYDQDPKKFVQAKKIEQTTWRKFRQIVGNRWLPGLNLPFDPVASRAAQQNGAKVIILNGEKLANLGRCLVGEKFKGTTIC